MSEPTQPSSQHDGDVVASGDELHELGAALILDAFDAARRSGRRDWHRMTIAVLKNRILLRDRGFEEGAWGARTVLDFASEFPELVSIDRSRRPPIVELHEAPATALSGRPTTASPAELPERARPGHPSAYWRVRSDLWAAVVDAQSDRVYVWDGSAAIGVPAGDIANQPVLPTLTSEELNAWRATFADQVRRADDQPETSHILDTWRVGKVPDAALPTRLRVSWVVQRKSNVRDRLVAWFDAENIAVPTDLVVVSSRLPGDEHGATEQLRDLIIRCVRTMTRAELEDLSLPPAAVLRART